MSWQGIEGHDGLVERFRRALERQRLGSTFLFVGPDGVGKRLFARKLAQSLLCETRPETALDPCGVCPSCQQVEAGTHPDLIYVGLPSGKSTIPLELLIGDDQHRMRQGLCYDISLKPMMGGRRIAILDDADHLKQPEGSNCLLKTLEEPPPRSLLILIGSSPMKQLPTIRSRAQIVRFNPLPLPTVADLLVRDGTVTDAAEAARLAAYSEGSLRRAIELADADLWSFRQQFLAALSKPAFDSVQLAKSIIAFVDEAGKDASARRARSRQVVNFAIDFYRQLIRHWTAAITSDDPELMRSVVQAASKWRGDAETAAACLERSHETLGHIDRNANQTILLECWIDDLATLSSGGRLASTHA